MHLDLSFTGSGVHAPATMTVKRLAIKFVLYAFCHLVTNLTILLCSLATDASGLTWGGQTYETGNGRVAGTLKTDTLPVAGGVDIKETEAILLQFK